MRKAGPAAASHPFCNRCAEWWTLRGPAERRVQKPLVKLSGRCVRHERAEIALGLECPLPLVAGGNELLLLVAWGLDGLSIFGEATSYS